MFEIDILSVRVEVFTSLVLKFNSASLVAWVAVAHTVSIDAASCAAVVELSRSNKIEPPKPAAGVPVD